jgi:hypothetical protein
MSAPALTAAYIIKSALRKLNVIPVNTDPDADYLQTGLDDLNEIFGQWNMRKRNAFFQRTQEFVFAAARDSYTIGTLANGANFQVSAGERPVKIESARLVLMGSTPKVYITLGVVNVDLYEQIPTPQASSDFPGLIYYKPAWPNGVIYPYPASPSDTSNALELRWWNQFDSIDIADVAAELQLPMGYKSALTLTLAELLYLTFPGRTNLALLQQQARIARSDVQAPNDPPKQISSVDGIQGRSGSTFDFRSRTF